MNPEGKVIIVTGASLGIGLEIAKALVREGAKVVFAARTLSKLKEEVAQVGGTAMAVEMDVTSDASVRAAVEAVVDRFGRIDAVVNNAGNGGALGFWATTDADSTRAMFDVHLFGAERVNRAVMPTMLRQKQGVIVNFASAVAWVAMPGAAAYSAAKAAVVSMSEAMRAELADQGIVVRVFAPPHTSTEAGKTWPLPLPKIFEPEWVAGQLVRALKGNQPVFIAGGNNLLVLIRRASPWLAAKMMNSIGFKAVAKAKLMLASGAPASGVSP